MKIYDTFPVNMLEMQGCIDRKSFHFIADNCKVWQQGYCIVDLDSTFVIDAEVNPFDGEIEVCIDNFEIEEYITDQISFSEISSLNDRVVWSNNILGGGEGFEYRDMSLFYCNGILSRIYFNRNNPLIMLEFNSNQQDEITDVENPLKKVAEIISNVTFVSGSHQRYENGISVSGLQSGCNRAIKIEKNINGHEGYNIKGGEGYIVTVFNLDGNHPIWGNNVQMTPKPMKIISQTDEQTILRGYQCEAMSPFGWIDFNGADYGLTIFHKYGEIDKCTLHMYNRNADIEYYKGDSHIVTQEPEIVFLSKQAIVQYQKQNLNGARNNLVQIYHSVKSNPQQLKDVSDFEILGKAFLFMFEQRLSGDIDTLQIMASIGYLCISKAILQNPHNLNLYRDRLLIMKLGQEPFKYTAMSALNLAYRRFADSAARDVIFKMEIADLELHPQLYQQIPFFKKMKTDFDENIVRQFLIFEKTTLDNLIKSGVECHKKIFEYLENKIIEEGDVDFNK
jgi:hypothetical protein